MSLPLLPYTFQFSQLAFQTFTTFKCQNQSSFILATALSSLSESEGCEVWTVSNFLLSSSKYIIHPFFLHFLSQHASWNSELYSFSLLLISHLFSKLFGPLNPVKMFLLSHQWPNCQVPGLFPIIILFDLLLTFAAYPFLESLHVGFFCTLLVFRAKLLLLGL